jgi:predicted acyl esterase
MVRPNTLFLYLATIVITPQLLLAQNNTQSAEIVQGTLRIYGNDSYPIQYRRALTNGAARARYPGFAPSTTILKAGSIHRDGAKALTCDILFERDVAMKLRDGTTMYTDIYRPVNSNITVPAIIGWSPYGKEIGGQWLDDITNRSAVPLESVSELQKFEGPDPAYWVAQGYAILSPDSRGAYASEGNITFWGRQLAEDGYDYIEWAAAQPWSSGKVAMSGNSWLAVSQWFIAAEQPPHLAAIAPWEGLTDLFRDSTNRGGMPSPGFQEAIITTFAGKNFVEDQPRILIAETLINQYWEDKIARLSNITVPAYIVASYTNQVHTHGSFQGFREIASADKWLRVHNTYEWPDYYNTAHVEDLRSFFDHYLKDVENGWEQTPSVRLAVLDPGAEDTLDRVVDSWPVTDLVPTTLYLQSNASLATSLPAAQDTASYDISTDSTTSASISFNYTMPVLAEMIGYMKLRIWVEAVGSTDMEISVAVNKVDANGNQFPSTALSVEQTAVSATGVLRVSHRELDVNRSTAYEPYLTHTSEKKLSPGEIVPVEIGFWPMALRFHPGEQLVLTITATAPTSALADLGFGTAMVPVPANGGNFAPGTNVSLIELGGATDSNPAYVNAQRVQTPASLNNGTHIIHFGGKYDSFLLLPLNISSTATSNWTEACHQ